MIDQATTSPVSADCERKGVGFAHAEKEGARIGERHCLVTSAAVARGDRRACRAAREIPRTTDGSILLTAKIVCSVSGVSKLLCRREAQALVRLSSLPD